MKGSRNSAVWVFGLLFLPACAGPGQAAYDEAITSRSRGRLLEAQVKYEEALTKEPQNPLFRSELQRIREERLALALSEARQADERQQWAESERILRAAKDTLPYDEELEVAFLLAAKRASTTALLSLYQFSVQLSTEHATSSIASGARALYRKQAYEKELSEARKALLTSDLEQALLHMQNAEAVDPSLPCVGRERRQVLEGRALTARGQTSLASGDPVSAVEAFEGAAAALAARTHAAADSVPIPFRGDDCPTSLLGEPSSRTPAGTPDSDLLIWRDTDERLLARALDKARARAKPIVERLSAARTRARSGRYADALRLYAQIHLPDGELHRRLEAEAAEVRVKVVAQESLKALKAAEQGSPILAYRSLRNALDASPLADDVKAQVIRGVDDMRQRRPGRGWMHVQASGLDPASRLFAALRAFAVASVDEALRVTKILARRDLKAALERLDELSVLEDEAPEISLLRESLEPVPSGATASSPATSTPLRALADGSVVSSTVTRSARSPEAGDPAMAPGPASTPARPSSSSALSSSPSTSPPSTPLPLTPPSSVLDGGTHEPSSARFSASDDESSIWTTLMASLNRDDYDEAVRTLEILRQREMQTSSADRTSDPPSAKSLSDAPSSVRASSSALAEALDRLQHRQFIEAEEILRRRSLRGLSTDRLVVRGALAVAMKGRGAREATLERAIVRDPDPRTAAELLTQSLTVDPSSRAVARALTGVVVRAQRSLRHGDIRDAAHTVEAVSLLEGASPSAREAIATGASLLAEKKFIEARDVFVRIVPRGKAAELGADLAEIGRSLELRADLDAAQREARPLKALEAIERFADLAPRYALSSAVVRRVRDDALEYSMTRARAHLQAGSPGLAWAYLANAARIGGKTFRRGKWAPKWAPVWDDGMKQVRKLFDEGPRQGVLVHDVRVAEAVGKDDPCALLAADLKALLLSKDASRLDLGGLFLSNGPTERVADQDATPSRVRLDLVGSLRVSIDSCELDKTTGRVRASFELDVPADGPPVLAGTVDVQAPAPPAPAEHPEAADPVAADLGPEALRRILAGRATDALVEALAGQADRLVAWPLVYAEAAAAGGDVGRAADAYARLALSDHRGQQLAREQAVEAFLFSHLE